MNILIDAHQFPGPALWQGIMLIVVGGYVLWLFGPSHPTEKQSIRVLYCIGIFGALLIVAILLLIP